MTHDDLELEAHRLNQFLRKIDKMAMEMRDDRNDGWVQDHYRQMLKNIRNHINKALEQ